MSRRANDVHRRLDALRAAVMLLMNEGYEPAYAGVAGASGPLAEPERGGSGGTHESKPRSDNEPDDDAELATSSEESEADRTRLIALVELARKGDKEAFGLLYDHYHGAVYRFLFYRTLYRDV
jgi:RNA polymerase sigma-70 factor (ECF subfamily)